MQSTIRFISDTLQNIYSQQEIGSLTRLIFDNVCQYSSIDLILHKNSILSDTKRQKVEAITKRLQMREPIQYILEQAHFLGHTFTVKSGVLIPRPETEELVDIIIKENKNKKGHLIDMGTGSGCIPISLALALPQFTTEGWDISENAIAIANENKLRLRVNTQFFLHDIFINHNITPLSVDIIVSNPPYICEQEQVDMDRNVLDHEPHLALFVPNETPLIYYQRIASIAQETLSNKGTLYFEINPLYCTEIIEMLAQFRFKDTSIIKDFSNKNRFIKATKNQ